MPAPIVRQECREPADCLAEVIRIRQEDQPQVVGVRPVETGALHDQHLLGFEQLEELAAHFGVDEVMVHPVAGASAADPADRNPAREESLDLLASAVLASV